MTPSASLPARTEPLQAVSSSKPFPSTTSDACELRAPPEVTLDGDPLRVLSHAFDGARVSFEVDIAPLCSTPTPDRETSLARGSSALACPKDTYDAATANLGTSATVVDPATPGRVSWIFPFNFFLVEEFAILADSIEALVELEITCKSRSLATTAPKSSCTAV